MKIASTNWFSNFLNLLAPQESNWSNSWNGYLSQNITMNFKLRIKQPDLDIGSQVYLSRIWVASDYSKEVQDLIWQAKRGGQWSIAKEFAFLVGSLYRENTLGIPRPDIITWAPADKRRLAERGYHLPQLIAASLGQHLSIQSQEMVTKVKSTKAQGELSRQQRLDNLQDCFQATDRVTKQSLKQRVVWIVDDIVTTGTTLNQTAKVIKAQMPWTSVYGIAIAGN